MKKNYIPSAILGKIKNVVKLELLSINYSDNNVVSNNLVEYSIHLSFVKNGPIKTQFYTFVTMVSKNWTEYSHSWKLYR
jgi:hypothetical protein